MKKKQDSPINLIGVDWADILRRLTLFVHRHAGWGGSLADAEKLASEAVTCFLDPGYSGWDPEREPDVARHLGSIVNDLLSDHARQSSFDRDRSFEETSHIEDPQYASSTETRAAESEQRDMISLLAKRIGGDKLVEDVVLLSFEGIIDASAQAAHLVVPIREIYNARRRLSVQWQAVKQQLATGASDVKKTRH